MAFNPATGEYSGPQNPFGVPPYMGGDPKTKVNEDGSVEIVDPGLNPERKFTPDRRKNMLRTIAIVGIGYLILKKMGYI